MNAEIRKRWTDALRSGEYQQGEGFLYVDGTFCCLGVLCDLHSKETGTKWERYNLHSDEPDDKCVKTYYDTDSYLPPEVRDWADLPTDIGQQFGRDAAYNTEDGISNLIELNDGGIPFTEIANVIERYF
jgi:hypothetical protein